MDNLPDWLKLAGMLIGFPVYIYVILRWMTTAVVTSYFEVKREYQPPIKKEAT